MIILCLPLPIQFTLPVNSNGNIPPTTSQYNGVVSLQSWLPLSSNSAIIILKPFSFTGLWELSDEGKQMQSFLFSSRWQSKARLVNIDLQLHPSTHSGCNITLERDNITKYLLYFYFIRKETFTLNQDQTSYSSDLLGGFWKVFIYPTKKDRKQGNWSFSCGTLYWL